MPSSSDQRPGAMSPGRYDGVASVEDTVNSDLLPPLQPRKPCGPANAPGPSSPRSTVVLRSRPSYSNCTVMRSVPAGTSNGTVR